MTMIFTASDDTALRLPHFRTRLESMMTTPNLTIVEWYHVVDRRSPRIHTADTQPLLLDCSRRPLKRWYDAPNQASTSELQKHSIDRPPTTVTQFPRTLLNIGHDVWPNQPTPFDYKTVNLAEHSCQPQYFHDKTQTLIRNHTARY